jgi:hypothetical protein
MNALVRLVRAPVLEHNYLTCLPFIVKKKDFWTRAANNSLNRTASIAFFSYSFLALTVVCCSLGAG